MFPKAGKGSLLPTIQPSCFLRRHEQRFQVLYYDYSPGWLKCQLEDAIQTQCLILRLYLTSTLNP